LNFGLKGFVFGFFAGEVVACEGGAVFDACGGEQVGDFAELAFFALEVADFDEPFFNQCGDEVVGFAFAHAQQSGEFALGDFRVAFYGAQDSEVDLFAWFHGAAKITVAQKWADYTDGEDWWQGWVSVRFDFSLTMMREGWRLSWGARPSRRNSGEKSRLGSSTLSPCPSDGTTKRTSTPASWQVAACPASGRGELEAKWARVEAGSAFAAVIATPFKVAAVSCQMTVYTKILTPSYAMFHGLLLYDLAQTAWLVSPAWSK